MNIYTQPLLCLRVADDVTVCMPNITPNPFRYVKLYHNRMCGGEQLVAQYKDVASDSHAVPPAWHAVQASKQYVTESTTVLGRCV